MDSSFNSLNFYLLQKLTFFPCSDVFFLLYLRRVFYRTGYRYHKLFRTKKVQLLIKTQYICVALMRNGGYRIIELLQHIAKKYDERVLLSPRIIKFIEDINEHLLNEYIEIINLLFRVLSSLLV